MSLDLQSINYDPGKPIKMEADVRIDQVGNIVSPFENGSVISINIPSPFAVVETDNLFGTHIREAVEIVRDWAREKKEHP
jgi:hypothetical protein